MKNNNIKFWYGNNASGKTDFFNSDAAKNLYKSRISINEIFAKNIDNKEILIRSARYISYSNFLWKKITKLVNEEQVKDGLKKFEADEIEKYLSKKIIPIDGVIKFTKDIFDGSKEAQSLIPIRSLFKDDKKYVNLWKKISEIAKRKKLGDKVIDSSIMRVAYLNMENDMKPWTDWKEKFNLNVPKLMFNNIEWDEEIVKCILGTYPNTQMKGMAEIFKNHRSGYDKDKMLKKTLRGLITKSSDANEIRREYEKLLKPSYNKQVTEDWFERHFTNSNFKNCRWWVDDHFIRVKPNDGKVFSKGQMTIFSIIEKVGLNE